MTEKQSNCFTAKSPQLERQLVSKCYISEAFLPESQPKDLKYIEFKAIWDTGATHTAITPKVVAKLGLKPISIVTMTHAGGSMNSNMFMISIGLPNKVAFHAVEVIEATLLDDDVDVLIGMDIIAQGDFAVTNFNQQTMFSFRYPSKEHISFAGPDPSIKPKGKIPGRNDACYCGSGKKYKHCHGK